jgi:hypothetical protein
MKQTQTHNTMNNTNNIPQAALDIIANAVAELEALRESLDAVVDNYHADETADVEEAKRAIRAGSAMDRTEMIDRMRELQKCFA